jgi:hypothetical protein
MDGSQFLIGVSGALVGVLGWLLVGLYIQKRAHSMQARDAGRAVYFELGANHLTIFIAAEYAVFGQLDRTNYSRLLPELSTWLPAAELQALVLAYLGHGGYEQAASDEELPQYARQAALSGLLEAHRVALDLLRPRVFSRREADSLNKYAGAEHVRLLEAADELRPQDR